jgi:hypothetical protein
MTREPWVPHAPRFHHPQREFPDGIDPATPSRYPSWQSTRLVTINTQVRIPPTGTFFHRVPILCKPLPATLPEHLGPLLGILVQNGCFSQNAGTSTNATHSPHKPP